MPRVHQRQRITLLRQPHPGRKTDGDHLHAGGYGRVHRHRPGGEGTLYFNGKAYPFYVGGLGIGGIGASTIEATGDVYRLNNIGDFPGAYSQVRYGAVAGTASTGEMWLNNPDGVIIHLQTQRTGLMLSLGGDAMVITLK